MNTTTHSLVIKLMVDRLKQHGYLGDCTLDKAPSILALWESGALRGVSSIRFSGSSKDTPIEELRIVHGWAITKIRMCENLAHTVAEYYGVPKESAEIFAEDMAMLILGGGMGGWRYSTTRDVFRHVYAAYNPKEYLTGEALHKKCSDPVLAERVIITLYDRAFGW